MRCDALRPGRVVAIVNVEDGQRQYALGRFLQRTIEHLVQFMLHHLPGDDGGHQPQHGHAERQAEHQPLLQAGGFHGAPRR